MKPKIFSIAIILCGLFLSLAAYPADLMKKTRIVGINAAVPSLLSLKATDSQRQAGIPFTGLLADLYACVLTQMNFDYEYMVLPVGRLEKMLELGRVDLAVLVARSSGRDAYASFSKTLLESEFVVVAKDSRKIDHSSLREWNIATTMGSVFEDMANESFNANIFGTVNWDSALKMLQADRVDGVYLAKVIMDNDVDPSLLIGTTAHLISKQPVGLYVSNKSEYHDEVLQQVNLSVGGCIIN